MSCITIPTRGRLGRMTKRENKKEPYDNLVRTRTGWIDHRKWQDPRRKVQPRRPHWAPHGFGWKGTYHESAEFGSIWVIFSKQSSDNFSIDDIIVKFGSELFVPNSFSNVKVWLSKAHKLEFCITQNQKAPPVAKGFLWSNTRAGGLTRSEGETRGEVRQKTRKARVGLEDGMAGRGHTANQPIS